MRLELLAEAHIDSLIIWRARKEAQLHQPITDLGREQLERFIHSRLPGNFSDLLDHDYILIIVDALSGDYVGWMTMEVTSRLHGLVRIGYTVDKPHWGLGYATAAVSELSRMLFNESVAGRIEADCSVHNPASRRVLEKCGFRLIGIKKDYLIIHGERVDHFYFELLKKDYLAAAAPR
ncbi:MAG: GNAT family N-acetyltransferase [Candidatus Marinimicrobia bacterium]|nr:GNAT family N-acetyltransferase [Candidatus Neomarinimicrobiota bacterium]